VLQVLDSPEVGEHFLLRLLAHRTGIEQDDVGLLRIIGDLQPVGLGEHVSHLARVVLVHLAAEGLDVYLASHV
jgi:hypothetical protein